MIESLTAVIGEHEVKFPLMGNRSLEKFDYSTSFFSVLVGPNGTNKSRVLASVANMLTRDLVAKKKKSGLRKKQVYLDCVLYPSDSQIKRAIAIASSPYDKFPIGTIHFKSEFDGNDSTQDYFYLGLRSKNGQGLRKNKDRIFEVLAASLEGAKSDKNYDALKVVFNKLNFAPTISILYQRGDGRAYFEKRKSGFSGYSDQEKKKFAKEGVRDEYFKITDVGDRVQLASLIRAEKDGRIIIKSLNVSKLDSSGSYDLLESSSGELSVFVHALGLSACLSDNCAILIDEPEISLHPNWQLEYADLLQSISHPFVGCHFIIATHSPHILGSLPPNRSAVIAIRRDKSKSIVADIIPGSTSGWSVDQVLLDVFGLQTVRSETFELRVRELLHLIADKSAEGRKKNIAHALGQFAGFQLNPDDPLRNLLRNAKDIVDND